PAPSVQHGTPDADFWYAPPELGATRPFPIPRPREINLSNGVRALLVERHHSPVASVSMVLHWQPPYPRAGIQEMLGRVVLQARDARGTPLSKRLWRSGVATAPFTTHLGFACPPEELSDSLAALLDALLHGELRADSLKDYALTAPERE